MEEKRAETRKRNKRKNHRGGFVGVLIIAFALVIVVNLLLSNDSRLETTIVRQGSEEDLISTRGYIFREQTVISAPADGYVYCEAAEDERVGAGEAVMYIYKTEINLSAMSELKAVEEKIKELSEGIRTSEVYSSDTAKIEQNIAQSLRGVSRLGAKGNLEKLAEISKTVNSLIEKRRVISGEIQPTDRSRELEELKKQKAELEQKYNIERTIIHSPKTGAFTSRVDGLEEKLSPAALDGINLDYIKELDKLSAEPKNVQKATSGEPVGKIVNNFAWSLAVVAETDKIEGIAVGDNLQIRFPDVGIETVSGRVSRITPEQSGKVILIIDSNKYIDNIYSSSKVKAELIRNSYEGFRIPAKSLRMTDGEMGVYVIRSNKARFVPVELLYNAGSWVVVREQMESAEHPKVLKLYDELIINGKDIYEGKVVR